MQNTLFPDLSQKIGQYKFLPLILHAQYQEKLNDSILRKNAKSPFLGHF